MSTVRVFCRCNSGHYFAGEHCPFDGWSSPTSKEIVRIAKRLARRGEPITLAGLQAAGFGRTALQRAVVMQFASQTAAFEALAPELCVVDGVATPLHELASTLK